MLSLGFRVCYLFDAYLLLLFLIILYHVTNLVKYFPICRFRFLRYNYLKKTWAIFKQQIYQVVECHVVYFCY